MDDYPDATLLMYAACLKPSVKTMDTHNRIDFNIDLTPFAQQRSPQNNTLSSGRSIQDKMWLDSFEDEIRRDTAELAYTLNRTHPVDQYKEFETWAATDVLHLGSSLHPSDYTVAIEYYKLENWVFNCITLNPQMQRHQLYDAPIRQQCHEKESLLVELQREPFNASEYETLIDSLECDTDKWGKEEQWTAKQTNQFVSHYLITPVRDNGKIDLGLQFESLIEQREKGRTDPFCGPNYDMQADTMSPYIPPQRAEQHPIMGTGHL
ncbi:MAG: hypothetical protein GY737_02505, partial [Desulfobacteraceae bacterium]|nr:hypothetical protein [Desulfobacteraceae bacterium]